MANEIQILTGDGTPPPPTVYAAAYNAISQTLRAANAPSVSLNDAAEKNAVRADQCAVTAGQAKSAMAQALEAIAQRGGNADYYVRNFISTARLATRSTAHGITPPGTSPEEVAINDAGKLAYKACMGGASTPVVAETITQLAACEADVNAKLENLAAEFRQSNASIPEQREVLTAIAENRGISVPGSSPEAIGTAIHRSMLNDCRTR